MQRRFDDVYVGSIELFGLAAELGSFTEAAKAAGITPAAVSRAIARLEQRLGAKLFMRSTRQMRLTDTGQQYFKRSRAALEDLTEAEREVSGQQHVPQGKLRISVPSSYGHYRLLPMLPRFRARYPLIEIDVQISNHNISFYEDGFDLAIRARAPSDGQVIARPLETSPMLIVASPEYLQRKGTPQSLSELAEHDCLQFCHPGTGRLMPWELQQEGRTFDWQPPQSIVCYDDVLGPLTLAQHGGGICQTIEFLARPALGTGRLVEILKPFTSGQREFTLLYPPNRHLSARVRAFVDFLLAEAVPSRALT